jgi:hypothetical protein
MSSTTWWSSLPPLSHDEERIYAYYDGEPLRYRTMEDLLGDQPVLGWCHTTWSCSCTFRVTTASLVAEAERDATWRAAMQWRWMQSNRTAPGSFLTSLVVTARSPLSECSS